MPVSEVYKLINAIDNNKTEFNSPLPISKELRDLLKIAEPNKSIDELKQQIEKENNQLKQQILDENNQTKEFIQQLMKDETNQLKQQMKEIQELLNNFITVI